MEESLKFKRRAEDVEMTDEEGDEAAKKKLDALTEKPILIKTALKKEVLP
jgi:hypothetical protein